MEDMEGIPANPNRSCSASTAWPFTKAKAESSEGSAFPKLQEPSDAEAVRAVARHSMPTLRHVERLRTIAPQCRSWLPHNANKRIYGSSSTSTMGNWLSCMEQSDTDLPSSIALIKRGLRSFDTALHQNQCLTSCLHASVRRGNFTSSLRRGNACNMRYLPGSRMG